MYNLKIIESPGRIEIYKINKYVVNESKKHEGYKIVERMLKDNEELADVINENKDEVKKDNREKNLIKARTNIMRLVQCNDDLRVFITLTFKEESDYVSSKALLNILFTKLRRDYKGLKYLWVLEYGDKNKRLHFHVVCNIPIGIKLANSNERKSEDHKKYENNFECKYWPHGFVDIRSLDELENNVSLALYISEYMVKGLENTNLNGYRCYGYSRKTLEKPIETKIYSKRSIEEIISMYQGYKVRYTNNYNIGYTNWRGHHEGNVIYIDLIKEREEF